MNDSSEKFMGFVTEFSFVIKVLHYWNYFKQRIVNHFRWEFDHLQMIHSRIKWLIYSLYITFLSFKNYFFIPTSYLSILTQLKTKSFANDSLWKFVKFVNYCELFLMKISPVTSVRESFFTSVKDLIVREGFNLAVNLNYLIIFLAVFSKLKNNWF